MLPALVSKRIPTGKQGILAGEVSDFLLRAVFENAEVFLLEPKDEAVHGIGDGDGNHDESRVYYDLLGRQESERYKNEAGSDTR